MDSSTPAQLQMGGSILLGALGVYLIVGAYFVQLHHYFMAGSEIQRRNRVTIYTLIGLVTVCEIMRVGFVTFAAWRVLVLGMENPVLRLSPAKTAPSVQILSSFITLFIQGFFAWRIWTHKFNRIIGGVAVLIGVFTTMQLIIGIFIGVQMGRIGAIAEQAAAAPARDGVFNQFINGNQNPGGLTPFSLTLGILSSATFACDVLITIGMFCIEAFDGAPSEERAADAEHQYYRKWAYHLDLLSLNAHSVSIERADMAPLGNELVVTRTVSLEMSLRIADGFHTFILVLYSHANVLMASLNGRTLRGGEESTTTSSKGAAVVSNFRPNPRTSLVVSQNPHLQRSPSGIAISITTEVDYEMGDRKRSDSAGAFV
ncbi:hypothetical protein FA15DRAFT_709653 [Coprinopsis marcescibilis]|uniref:Uncharacterized protein n=1 Tax=Coprinopsis marcescibilis TaxID=230819 RepID=A0A5C3KEW5_COPMA|nr:hypothetical protein FA15DRAFT_709653 [Coprinopsis marcescibilis]